jgi:hypothetical protein
MEADHGDNADDSTESQNSRRHSARKVGRLILTTQINFIKLRKTTEGLTERQLPVP